MNLSEQFMNWSPKKRLWATVLGVGAAVLLLVIAAVLLVCLGGDGRQTMKTESEESWYIPSMGSLPPLPAVGQASSDLISDFGGASKQNSSSRKNVSSIGGAFSQQEGGTSSAESKKTTDDRELPLQGFQKVAVNVAANQLLGGRVCEQDGWVYYFSLEKGDMEQPCLKKMRTDGTEQKTLCSDVSPFYISVYDGWVYYLEVKANEGIRSYRVRTDGTEKQRILTERDMVIHVSGGWCYVVDTHNSDDLSRVRLDGTQRQTLHKLTAKPIFYENYLYYIDARDRCPYQMNLDTSKTIKLSNEQMEFMQIQGDWMVYQTYGAEPGGTYKMQIGSSKTQKVYSGYTQAFLSQDAFYYLDMETAQLIYEKQGRRMELSVLPIGVVGDKIICPQSNSQTQLVMMNPDGSGKIMI